MNLSTADLRNYRTEFHETWWSYRYMFPVDPKVFRFVVKGVKAIFLGVQRGWGLIRKIIIRNGAKTISLQTLFGRLNYLTENKSLSWPNVKLTINLRHCKLFVE
jgi:hypothetical protein